MKRSSVLPKIAFTPKEDGALFVADRVGWKDVTLIFFFAVGVAVNLYVFTLDEVDEVRRLIGLLYGIVSLVALVSYERDYRLRKRLRGVTLTVRPWPLRLGDEVKAQLRVRPAAPVAAKLECLEIATKGGGKFQTTERSGLYSLELPDADWTFVVPDHLPPSFEAKDNKVVWQIIAMVESSGADIPVTFQLLVIPEVAG